MQVLDEPIAAAIIPGWDGAIGILHDHSPLLVKLGEGKLKLEFGSSDKWFFIAGGFAQVADNKLSILTKEAIPAEEIKAATAEAMLKEVHERVVTTTLEMEKKNRDLNRAHVYAELAGIAK